eukprot:scaffold1239_cov319-Prasinococcus_capsulatus_cf.AAC.8
MVQESEGSDTSLAKAAQDDAPKLTDDCLLSVMLWVDDCATLASMAACCRQWHRVVRLRRSLTGAKGTSLTLKWRLSKDQSRPRNSLSTLQKVLYSSTAIDTLELWLPLDRHRSRIRKERANSGRSTCNPALREAYGEIGTVLSDERATFRCLCIHGLQEDDALDTGGWRKTFARLTKLVCCSLLAASSVTRHTDLGPQCSSVCADNPGYFRFPR